MHTVPLTTGVPALASRMRLPRHHAAQRDQAIANALDLVRRLEELTEGVQLLHPLDEQGYSEVSSPEPCGCEFADRLDHDDLVDLLAARTPEDVLDAITDGYTWDDQMHIDDAIPSWAWAEFAAQHNFPDPALTYKVVQSTSWIRDMYIEWKDAKRSGRATTDAIDTKMDDLKSAVAGLDPDGENKRRGGILPRLDALEAIVERTPAAYERIRAQRDRVWVDWGDDGAPDHPTGEDEARWHAQGIVEGLAMAMTVIEQEGQR